MSDILIVEDVLELAENYVELLSHLGFKDANVVTCAEDCLTHLKLNVVNLILIDITLSGEVDGISLAKIINENWNLPIIFVSAHSDEATLNRVSKIVHSSYLLKPFCYVTLKSAIFSALNLVIAD